MLKSRGVARAFSLITLVWMTFGLFAIFNSEAADAKAPGARGVSATEDEALNYAYHCKLKQGVPNWDMSIAQTPMGKTARNGVFYYATTYTYDGIKCSYEGADGRDDEARNVNQVSGPWRVTGSLVIGYANPLPESTPARPVDANGNPVEGPFLPGPAPTTPAAAIPGASTSGSNSTNGGSGAGTDSGTVDGGSAPVSAPTLETDKIQELSDGLAFYALAAAVTGIFISAALWALGSKGQNPGQELTGKRGIIVCLAAGFAVGGLVPFMNKLDAMAETVSGDATTNIYTTNDAYNNCVAELRAGGGGGNVSVCEPLVNGGNGAGNGTASQLEPR